jgi:hypothetical protein
VVPARWQSVTSSSFHLQGTDENDHLAAPYFCDAEIKRCKTLTLPHARSRFGNLDITLAAIAAALRYQAVEKPTLGYISRYRRLAALSPAKPSA